jgi:aspartyl-tRNA(Asn)/glutamyl-tRNA(Gln) amidotransferase subunit B
VLNAEAVRLAVKAALALGATVHTRSVFARKNYFYPDLPKGYQITQYEEPLASGGWVEIESAREVRKVGLIRLHLEEDAGKSIHEGGPDSAAATYIDLNRCGIPLLEIVSRPEIRSPEEAGLYLRRLRSVLRYTGVCDGDMEKGSLRCDANVSVPPGARVELKNLNSVRNVRHALEYEIRRHAEILDSGGEVTRETVLWDEAAGVSRPMRSKEEVRDYRYFPEPDLPALELDAEWIAEIAASLPVLPAERKKILIETYGLNEAEAHVLSSERELADYYEEVAAGTKEARITANFILNDLLREQKQAARPERDIPVPAARLAELIRMVVSGAVSVSTARRQVFPEMYRSGGAPAEIVKERGLEQVGDDDTLRLLARRVLEDHPIQVESYRAGKGSLLEFFMGRIMDRSGGRADPEAVRRILEEMLEP